MTWVMIRDFDGDLDQVGLPLSRKWLRLGVLISGKVWLWRIAENDQIASFLYQPINKN